MLSVMKSLLSCKVIVPSKSVKKMNFGFLNGLFIAGRSDTEGDMVGSKELLHWMCKFV